MLTQSLDKERRNKHGKLTSLYLHNHAVDIGHRKPVDIYDIFVTLLKKFILPSSLSQKFLGYVKSSLLKKMLYSNCVLKVTASFKSTLKFGIL